MGNRVKKATPGPSFAQAAPGPSEAHHFAGDMGDPGAYAHFGHGMGIPAQYLNPFEHGHIPQQQLAPQNGRHPLMDASGLANIPPQGMPMTGFPMNHMGFMIHDAHHPLPPHMQMQASPDFGPNSSGEFDEGALGYDGDASLSTLGNEDSMEMRLHIAQQAQAAAADLNGGVFACPYCDKEYYGKHARSIWRRHLQDKHAIPLSQQPRRTRWDGDANRPKNAEERRQRMLESKRRWARKKRMLDKEARLTGEDDSAVMTPDFSDEEDSSMSPQVTRDAKPIVTKPAVELAQTPYVAEPDFPVASTSAIGVKAPKAVQQPAKKKREPKTKGPQQIKFHHMTTADIPSYGEHGQGFAMGPTVWTFADGKPTTGPQMGASAARIADRSALAMANFANTGMPVGRQFKREASAPSLQPQVTSSMMSSLSPRRAFGEVDTNTANARRMARSASSIDAFQGAGKPLFQADSGAKPYPPNQFAVPPPVSFAASRDIASMRAPNKGNQKANTKASDRTRALSPQRAAQQQVQGRIMNTILSPASSKKHALAASANNPFSLDRHRISPPDSERRGYEMSHEGHSVNTGSIAASPMRKRLTATEVESSALSTAASASPLSKSRRLPPLVKTPLRPARLADAPTPDNAMGLRTGPGSTSVKRPSAASGMATPTSSRMERLLGGSTSIGLTPFDAKLAGNFSVTRNGFFARPSPLKRGEGDQFSSPQHLNLTQSLGLAPHSTMKSSSSAIGSGVMGSVGATPFINSILHSNSPWTKDLWPESVFRQSTYSTGEIRNGNGSPSGGSSSAHSKGLRSSMHGNEQADSSRRAHHDDEEDDEEDHIPATLFLNETPSRPAKMRHSAFFDSPTSNSSSARKKRRTASPRKGAKTSAHASPETREIRGTLPHEHANSAPSKSPLRSSQRFDAPTASFDGELAATQAASASAHSDRPFNSSSPAS